MIIKLLQVATVLSFVFFTSFAQAEGPKIWIEPRTMGMDRITNGTITVTPTFMRGYDLTPLVKDNPKAMAHVEEQERYTSRAGYLSLFLGLPSTAGVVYGIAAQNLTVGVISGAVMLINGIFVFHAISQARYHMISAINTYNGVPESSSQEHSVLSHPRFDISLAPEGTSARVSFQF